MTSEIINLYDKEVRSLFDVKEPGTIHAAKGRIVESIAKMIVKEAWDNLGGKSSRLEFKNKKTRIPVNSESVHLLPKYVQQEILPNGKVYYDLSVDVNAYIDENFALGIECKAYTENAMLKRILVDFSLLKSIHPNLICCLLQLETFLGGENTNPGSKIANSSTYTLMSYFPKVNLHIYTLLEGNRDIKCPIHKKEYFKSMGSKYVTHSIESIASLLKTWQ